MNLFKEQLSDSKVYISNIWDFDCSTMLKIHTHFEKKVSHV